MKKTNKNLLRSGKRFQRHEKCAQTKHSLPHLLSTAFWFVILQYYHLVAIVQKCMHLLKTEEEAEVKQRQVLFQNVLSHCRWRGNYSGRQQEGKHFFYTQNCSHLQTNFQIWYNYDALTAITNRKYVQLAGIMTSVFKKASRDRRDLDERWYFSANILVLVTFSNTNHREISTTSYTDKKTIKNYIFLTK